MLANALRPVDALEAVNGTLRVIALAFSGKKSAEVGALAAVNGALPDLT
jgi:hypothetical protein